MNVDEESAHERLVSGNKKITNTNDTQKDYENKNVQSTTDENVINKYTADEHEMIQQIQPSSQIQTRDQTEDLPMESDQTTKHSGQSQNQAPNLNSDQNLHYHDEEHNYKYESKKQQRDTPTTVESVDNTSNKSDDEAILEFLKETEQKTCVIGTGGSGTNTLNRLFELGVDGVKLIATNTDAKHLLRIKADKKIILGKKLTRGQGAGSNPEVGADAAKESISEIVKAVEGASLVFITCGLGGGTGTGSAPIIAEAVKKMGAMVVAIVTFPFSAEGRVRLENAMDGFEKLRKYTDTIIVIKNDKLLTIAPDLPLNTAFKVCDEVLAGSLKGIVELTDKSGLVNVDFADLTTIIKDGGSGVIGMGEASIDAKREDRARIALEIAMNSPMLDADLSNATRALVNVVGGEDMSLKEAEYIVSETAKRIHPNAHIIWGARLEKDMKKSAIRVLLVLTGVKFQKFETEINTEDLENLDLDLIG